MGGGPVSRHSLLKPQIQRELRGQQPPLAETVRTIAPKIYYHKVERFYGKTGASRLKELDKAVSEAKRGCPFGSGSAFRLFITAHDSLLLISREEMQLRIRLVHGIADALRKNRVHTYPPSFAADLKLLSKTLSREFESWSREGRTRQMAESCQVDISFDSKILKVPILVGKPEVGLMSESLRAMPPIRLEVERIVCTRIDLNLVVPTLESAI